MICYSAQESDGIYLVLVLMVNVVSWCKNLIGIVLIATVWGCGSKGLLTDTEVEEPATRLLTSEEKALVKMDPKTLSYEQSYDRALTLWPVPFESIKVPTSKGNAHVLVTGPENGAPLVILHGLNASSTMWYPNIKAFSSKYRVYAIDFLLEPGKSEKKGVVLTTKGILTWYEEIFDYLKLKEFDIVGASRGGWLSINIALNNPKRIKRMALLSPAQTFAWIPPSSEVLTNISFSISPKRKNLDEVLGTLSSDVKNIDQLYKDQYFIATQEMSINTAFAQMTPFNDRQFKSLTMPILVLIGDDDFINPPESLAKAKAVLPHAEARVVSNSGHFLSMDQADEVNEDVLRFLSR